LFQPTLDQAFGFVIRSCAAPGKGRRSTWISPQFIEAYTDLHRLGFAHSLEVWQEGEIVGGIYGVGIGAYFAGESMFHTVDNASKAALFYLMQHLKIRGYTLFDVQMPTRITLQMGATFLPRSLFLHRLEQALQQAVSFGKGASLPASIAE
jgi:leucyl/phenylalanyl-tRNA--protein transferase